MGRAVVENYSGVTMTLREFLAIQAVLVGIGIAAAVYFTKPKEMPIVLPTVAWPVCPNPTMDTILRTRAKWLDI